MTDISVIKMIISVAVWRIYPSWVNDRLRAWEGLGHSEIFWARLSRDDFRSKLEIISFLSRVMSVSKSFFCFPRFWKIWRQMFKLWGFWFRRCFGALFENSAPSPGIFLRTLTTTTSISWKFPFFFFSKAELVLLAWQLWRSQVWANHFGDGTSKTRMKTRLPGVGEIERRRTIDRRRDWYESCAMIHGPEEKIKKHKKKTQGSQRVIVRRLNPSSSTNQRDLRSLFPRPDVATVSHFAVFVDVDVQLQDSQAAARGQRRKAVIRDISGVDHWGVTNSNELEVECTDMVHWTEALHRFSSRDAIIVVGSVLEKHFDSDFTPDQEKEITFKRWPQGYQSWKLGLALNGLIVFLTKLTFWSLHCVHFHMDLLVKTMWRNSVMKFVKRST